MKGTLPILYSILLLFLLLSCTKEDDTPQTARRTLLVYLGGNNNLSNEVSQKLDSITSGWHNTHDNLLVFRAARNETPSLLQIVAHPTNPYTLLIKEYPGSNAANATVFAEVVQDAQTMFPASSYGLLVFSHGTGWLPESMFLTPRSIINDAGREMEIADFARAIPDHTFHFIVMEACLMASVEVAYELRNKANFLVASSAEILSPGFTPLYPELIGYLFEPEANLTAFAQSYYTHCNSLNGLFRSGTISLLNLSEMEELAEVTHSALSSKDYKPVDLPTVQCFDRSDDKLFFDFGDYMEQVNPTMYGEVEKAIAKVVLYQAATPSFVTIPIRKHSGLTMYIEQDKYPELNKSYQQTNWYKQINY